MAQESDFISKVVCPYEKIQHSIRKYKEDRETLSIAFDQVSGKLSKLFYIREQALHLKDNIRQLDKIDNDGDLLYLSYIEPQLEELIMELDVIGLERFGGLLNRISIDLNELIEEIKCSERINLQTFI